MSDILIKNMEMPKSCYTDDFKYCPMHFFDYNTGSHCSISTCRCTSTKRPKGCPLVELHKHGDLKDFNDILNIFDKVLNDVDDATNELLCDILVQIGFAPTVVEATK